MATYLILNLAVIIAFVLIARRSFTPDKRWAAALAGLLLLTAVFDSVIVASGIVDYDPAKILGLRIGAAPIEDFFYALGALIVVPALWRTRKGGNG